NEPIPNRPAPRAAWPGESSLGFANEHLFGYDGCEGQAVTNSKRSAALAPPVADAIAAFSPKMASAELWAEHGHLVIARVELTAPGGPEAARRLLSAGVGLLAWAEKNHVPLRDDVLFSDETIE